MVDPNRGFSRERFPDLKGDSFDCGICYLICRDPKECTKCGAMFCKYCIDDWTSKRNECPIGCTDARTNIKPITGALAKIYKNLDIYCQYPNCSKLIKLCELTQHEVACQLPKCEFFEFCGNYVKNNLFNSVCSEACALMKRIKEANGDMKLIYQSVKNFTNLPKLTRSDSGLKTAGPCLVNFKWDLDKVGRSIQVTNNQKAIFLQENSYVFRSVIGDRGFMEGIHYWEIIADKRTENELKVGVSLRRDFNCDTSFSDYNFGFAYYGLGQLRNGSNSTGSSYGKKFKNQGVLGVCLDMNKGTLSFALDGEYWGVAFQNEDLKKGPIYPAVSMLHFAGCTLETGKAVPSYFIRNG